MLLNDDASRLIRSRVGALDMYNLTNCDMCERNRLTAECLGIGPAALLLHVASFMSIR